MDARHAKRVALRVGLKLSDAVAIGVASVYMTVQGRSQDTTEAIVESGARLGVESGHEWIRDYSPEFIDFPFTDPDATFSDHLRVVKETRPEIAVAPDIEKGRSLSEVVTKATVLSWYADSIIVVPKSVHPSAVPDRFRVGVPLADFGSGAPWSVWDYRDCGPVHLLGGGASRQLRMCEYLDVASVDTATMGKACRFGYWDGVGEDAPDGWDYKRRLRESLDNYAETWANV